MMVRQTVRHAPIRIAGMVTLGVVVVSLGGASTDIPGREAQRPALIRSLPRHAERDAASRQLCRRS